MAEEFLSDHVEASEPQSSKAIASSRPDREPVKIMVIGSRWAVMLIIHTLHQLRFAQANDWSTLQIEPITRQWMSVLIKWVKR